MNGRQRRTLVNQQCCGDESREGKRISSTKYTNTPPSCQEHTLAYTEEKEEKNHAMRTSPNESPCFMKRMSKRGFVMMSAILTLVEYVFFDFIMRRLNLAHCP
jgi:hypothetical protein